MPAAKKTENTENETNNTLEDIDVKDKKKEEKPEAPKEDLTFNPEKKVTIRSIANWTTGFKRIETNGDATIPANGSIRLTASEIIAQVQNGNTLFIGTDERGSHATLYIEDKATRIEADFESEDSKQNVINTDSVKELFKKSKTSFIKELPQVVITRAEKYAIIDIIRKEKLFDDYEKVRAVEDHTGLRV